MTGVEGSGDAARHPAQQRLDAVLGHLVDVLVDLGVPERIIDQAQGLAAAIGALGNFRGLDRNTAAALTDAIRQARPVSADTLTGHTSACRALTAVIRVRGLVDELPDEVVAADDVADELQRLAESIDAAQRHALPIRNAGRQVERACSDDLRRSTRVRLDLDLIHDIESDELVAVLLARLERSLDEVDVDVADIATRWEARPPLGT